MAKAPRISDLSFEDALARLEGIVQKLESGDSPLDQAIDLYAEGEALRRQCEDRLKAAQARIEKVTLDRERQTTGVEPLDPD